MYDRQRENAKKGIYTDSFNDFYYRKMKASEKTVRKNDRLFCGAPMTMNLRCDSFFVQDEGWYAASERYSDFIRRHKNSHVLFLELGVGGNTPGIIKYPFWQMTMQNPRAVYACLNLKDAAAPREIAKQSICIQGDGISVSIKCFIASVILRSFFQARTIHKGMCGSMEMADRC